MRAEKALTRVDADVLYQTSHALVGVAAVAALVLSVAGPLQAVHLHLRPVLHRQAHLHRRRVQAVLLTPGGNYRQRRTVTPRCYSSITDV